MRLISQDENQIVAVRADGATVIITDEKIKVREGMKGTFAKYEGLQGKCASCLSATCGTWRIVDWKDFSILNDAIKQIIAPIVKDKNTFFGEMKKYKGLAKTLKTNLATTMEVLSDTTNTNVKLIESEAQAKAECHRLTQSNEMVIHDRDCMRDELEKTQQRLEAEQAINKSLSKRFRTQIASIKQKLGKA